MQMTPSPKPENPLEKKIFGLKHYLHGIASTDDGKAHEGLVSVLAETIELVESLSVRSVNDGQQIKDMMLYGERVMLDPSNPKDLQSVVYELRDQIATLTDWTKKVEESAVDNRKWAIVDAFMAASAGRKESLDPYEPNHFQSIVRPFAKHGNSIIATHKRAGKNVYCYREAADFSLLNPGTRTIIFTARPTEEVNLRPFFPTDNMFTEYSKTPCQYKLKNNAVIQIISAGRIQKGTLCGVAADRIFVTEASAIDSETMKGISPLMFGDHGRRPITTILWTPLSTYETQAHIIEGFWNHPSYAQLRYPVTHNPEYAGKIEEIRTQTTSHDFRFEWMAEVPEKPKHTCNCHPRKGF